MTSRNRLAVAVCTLIVQHFDAAASAQEVARHDAGPIMPATITQIKRLSELRYSSRRHQLAFVVSASAAKPGGASRIWLHDVGAAATRPLTSGNGNASHPRWCPSGDCIAYLSKVGDATQIRLLRMDGGEPETVTSDPNGVSTFEWSPKGDRVAYLTDVDGTYRAPRSMPETATQVNVERLDEQVSIFEAKHQQLWILDTDSGTQRPLLDTRWRVSALTWVPNGASVIISASQDLDSEIEHDRLFIVDADDGEIRELGNPNRDFVNLAVSPDGQFLSYVAVRDVGAEPFDLFLLPLNGEPERNLTATTLDRKVEKYRWVDNRTLAALVHDGFDSPTYLISLDGRVSRQAKFPVNPESVPVAAGAVEMFLGSSFSNPTEVWIARADNGASPVTTINGHVKLADGGISREQINYESFDGLEIEAVLLKPRHAEYPLPIVAMIHGGPTWRWADTFGPSWSELLASRGIGVLMPNVRGSTGYSYEFLLQNIDALGDGDFRDVMAGLDYLVEGGIADPDRLGIAGWSYGGYMAAWAVTQSNRFKVAVSGAPVTNWLSEYGTGASSINRYDRALLGSPYGRADSFLRISPVSHADKVTTPVLLLCAERDVIDPISQCWEFHRGLRQARVASEYVIYKGVGHSRASWSIAQRVDAMHRVVDWVLQHLKGN